MIVRDNFGIAIGRWVILSAPIGAAWILSMICFELDRSNPFAVRSETIRIARGMSRSYFDSKQIDGFNCCKKFFAISTFFKDLELVLVSISQSLADGVAHTAGE